MASDETLRGQREWKRPQSVFIQRRYNQNIHKGNNTGIIGLFQSNCGVSEHQVEVLLENNHLGKAMEFH